MTKRQTARGVLFSVKTLTLDQNDHHHNSEQQEQDPKDAVALDAVDRWKDHLVSPFVHLGQHLGGKQEHRAEEKREGTEEEQNSLHHHDVDSEYAPGQRDEHFS